MAGANLSCNIFEWDREIKKVGKHCPREFANLKICKIFHNFFISIFSLEIC